MARISGEAWRGGNIEKGTKEGKKKDVARETKQQVRGNNKQQNQPRPKHSNKHKTNVQPAFPKDFNNASMSMIEIFKKINASPAQHRTLNAFMTYVHSQ